MKIKDPSDREDILDYAQKVKSGKRTEKQFHRFMEDIVRAYQ